MKEGQQIFRYDRVTIPITSMKLTPEGYLQGDAFLTKSGVFPYLNADGTVRYELRHPDEVFKKAHLDSMVLKPVTWEHPLELVTADNSRFLSIGTLGENIRQHTDSVRVVGSVIITRGDSVEAISRRSKIEVSLGYTLTLVKDSGVHKGVAFDFRQTGMLVNHAAITQMGRAGKDVKLVLDSHQQKKESKIIIMFNNDILDGEMPKRNDGGKFMNITINGVAYKCDSPEIVNDHKQLADKVAADIKVIANKDASIETLTKEVATLKAARDTAKDELKKETDGRQDAIDKAVKARSDLLAEALPFTGDSWENEKGDKIELTSLDNDEIKMAVIQSKYETFDNKDSVGKDKGDLYMNARYDGVIEAGVPSSDGGDEHNDGITSQRKKAFQKKKNDDSGDVDNSDGNKHLDNAQTSFNSRFDDTLRRKKKVNIRDRMK